MSLKECRCPSYKGLNYEEVIIASGLLGRKNESKNCCEEAGYICPTLLQALKVAQRKTYYQSNNEDTTKRNKTQKVLTKKKLSI